MPSPFPGMDPYIENPDVWSSFHARLVVHLAEELNRLLPSRYYAEAERHIWLHEPSATERMLARPDVEVSQRSEPSASLPANATIVTAPVTTVIPAELRRGSLYAKIVERQRERIVTVLELLSPANKTPGPDREAYLAKRGEYLASHLNVVEVDLLRSGIRMSMGEPTPTPTDYFVLVSRTWQWPHLSVWPFSVREPFPPLAVPLSVDEGDVVVSLRLCVDRVYDGGRFGSRLPYTQAPTPPFYGADAEWVRSVVKHN